MLRTIFMIGLFALAGLFVLKFFFGILPGILGLIAWLFFLAVKIALVGGVIYLAIRIFSPDTARRVYQAMLAADPGARSLQYCCLALPSGRCSCSHSR